MTPSTADLAPTGTTPDRAASGSRWSRIVDEALALPLFLKLLLANIAIAVAAGVAALLLVHLLVDAPLRGAATVSLAVFVVAVVVLTTVLNAVVVRLALSPLSELAEAAERIQAGNLSARVPISRLADRSTRRLAVLFNRMMDTLQAGRRRQQELARRILDAEERERAHIAHALYSGPAQTLAGVMVRLRLARKLGSGDPAAQPGLTRELRDEIADALDEIRALARRLRPPELGEIGVRAALEAHARTLTEGTGIAVAVHGELDDDALDREKATVLFRVLQEAVTNSVTHSGGQAIDISFTSEPGMLVAEVVDDGHGFDELGRLRAPSRGVGIAGMHERASYAGGTVTVASSTGEGTRVRVELPCRDPSWRSAVSDRARIAAELGVLDPDPAVTHAVV